MNPTSQVKQRGMRNVIGPMVRYVAGILEQQRRHRFWLVVVVAAAAAPGDPVARLAGNSFQRHFSSAVVPVVIVAARQADTGWTVAAGKNRSIGSLASESPFASLAVVVVVAAADVGLVVVVMTAAVVPGSTDWRWLRRRPLLLRLQRVADEWPRARARRGRLCPFRPSAQLPGSSVRPWLTDRQCRGVGEFSLWFSRFGLN